MARLDIGECGLTDPYILFPTASSTGILFAGATFGAFRSLDDGETWTQINSGLSSNLPILPHGEW